MKKLFSLVTPDALCGLKSFRRAAVLPAFEHLQQPGWLFDIEIMQAVNQLRVLLIPVQVRDNPDSKFTLLDPLLMAFEMVKLRLRQ